MITFATKLRMKYITPCLMSVFHSVEDDGILKSPMMVKTKSTKSYNMPAPEVLIITYPLIINETCIPYMIPALAYATLTR
jgi:hypothetical protein